MKDDRDLALARAFSLVFLNILTLGEDDLPPGARAILRSFPSRVIIVACIVYSTTREPLTALAGSALFAVVVRALLNPRSPLCAIPGTLKRMEQGGERPGSEYMRARRRARG